MLSSAPIAQAHMHSFLKALIRMQESCVELAKCQWDIVAADADGSPSNSTGELTVQPQLEAVTAAIKWLCANPNTRYTQHVIDRRGSHLQATVQSLVKCVVMSGSDGGDDDAGGSSGPVRLSQCLTHIAQKCDAQKIDLKDLCQALEAVAPPLLEESYTNTTSVRHLPCMAPFPIQES